MQSVMLDLDIVGITWFESVLTIESQHIGRIEAHVSDIGPVTAATSKGPCSCFRHNIDIL